MYELLRKQIKEEFNIDLTEEDVQEMAEKRLYIEDFLKLKAARNKQ